MQFHLPDDREMFQHFWDDLRDRWPRASSLEWAAATERPRAPETHMRGWTQSVTDASEFFGIQESNVPCIVLLSMRERHGTVIPFDESFGVYDFLKRLVELMGHNPVTIRRVTREIDMLRYKISNYRPTDLLFDETKPLRYRLPEADLLPHRVEGALFLLNKALPEGASIEQIRAFETYMRSTPEPNKQRDPDFDLHLLLLEQVIEKHREMQDELAQAEEDLEVALQSGSDMHYPARSIGLSGLIARVAAELPSPLDEEEDMAPAPRLPDWSFSRLGRTSDHTVQSTASTRRAGQLGLVMVHGFLSKPSVWDPLRELLAEDPDLGFVDPLAFGYRTGLVRLNPTRVFPTINVVADSLKEYLATEAEGYERLILLTHSMGGLVVQRCLTRMLAEGKGHELSRIRRVVLLACPNSGTEILLSVRRGVLGGRNPHERQLRPLNEDVTNTRRVIMRDVVHALKVTDRTCPIPFSVYAGESDNIVPAPAAQDVFPDAAALPGDHSSIARPTDRQHRTYTTLRRLILQERHP
ncbi:alpha/beta fold hydrolase [Streptomyces erythrochromogenes]|uniref:alpha/beta fold hydrolase n=1 Tax=Streptomyces erythrochromogenes TaxID=285574 RepID=UPI00342FC09C